MKKIITLIIIIILLYSQQATEHVMCEGVSRSPLSDPLRPVASGNAGVFTTGVNLDIVAAILKEVADGDGRAVYEDRGYAIAQACGFSPTKRRLVASADEINDTIFNCYSSKVVFAKAVAEGLAHKKRESAVMRLNVEEAGAMDKLKNFCTLWQQAEGFKGILLCEQVEVEDELMVGLMLDPQFGPVMKFGRGGSGVESEQDTVSILIPEEKTPLELRELIEKRVLQTEVGKTVKQQGNLAKLLDILINVAVLGSSFYSDEKFVITEMDINPFGFTKDGKAVAMDFLLGFESMNAPDKNETGRPKPWAYYGVESGQLRHRSTEWKEGMDGFFHPKKIGILYNPRSNGKKGIGDVIRDFLLASPAFSGNDDGVVLLDVNNLNTEALPELDLIVVVTRADEKLMDNLERIAEIREVITDDPTRFIIISAGFGESGQKDLQSRLDTFTVQHNIKILGPNCLGLFHTGREDGFSVLFIPLGKVRAPELDKEGDTWILAQSGGFVIMTMDLKPKVSFGGAVSFGNAFDVGPADLLRYLIDNKDRENVKKVILYLEGFRPGEGRALYEAVENAQDAGIKVDFYYGVSRVEGAEKSALSHTAAMASDIAEELLLQTGADKMIKRIDETFDCERALAQLSADREHLALRSRLLKRIKKGEKIGIAVGGNSGGDMVNSYEALLDEPCVIEFSGLTPGGAADQLLQETEFSSAFTPQLPMDFTGAGKLEHCQVGVHTLFAEPSADLVVISIVPSVPQLNETPNSAKVADTSIGRWITDLKARYKKPVVVSMPTDFRRWEYLRAYFNAKGIPCVTHPSQAARVFNEWLLSPVRERILPSLQTLSAITEEETGVKMNPVEFLQEYLNTIKKGPGEPFPDKYIQAVRAITGYGFDHLVGIGMPTLVSTGFDPYSVSDIRVLIDIIGQITGEETKKPASSDDILKSFFMKWTLARCGENDAWRANKIRELLESVLTSKDPRISNVIAGVSELQEDEIIKRAGRDIVDYYQRITSQPLPEGWTFERFLLGEYQTEYGLDLIGKLSPLMSLAQGMEMPELKEKIMRQSLSNGSLEKGITLLFAVYIESCRYLGFGKETDASEVKRIPVPESIGHLFPAAAAELAASALRPVASAGCGKKQENFCEADNITEKIDTVKGQLRDIMQFAHNPANRKRLEDLVEKENNEVLAKAISGYGDGVGFLIEIISEFKTPKACDVLTGVLTYNNEISICGITAASLCGFDQAFLQSRLGEQHAQLLFVYKCLRDIEYAVKYHDKKRWYRNNKVREAFESIVKNSAIAAPILLKLYQWPYLDFFVTCLAAMRTQGSVSALCTMLTDEDSIVATKDDLMWRAKCSAVAKALLGENDEDLRTQFNWLSEFWSNNSLARPAVQNLLTQRFGKDHEKILLVFKDIFLLGGYMEKEDPNAISAVELSALNYCAIMDCTEFINFLCAVDNYDNTETLCKILNRKGVKAKNLIASANALISRLNQMSPGQRRGSICTAQTAILSYSSLYNCADVISALSNVVPIAETQEMLCSILETRQALPVNKIAAAQQLAKTDSEKATEALITCFTTTRDANIRTAVLTALQGKRDRDILFPLLRTIAVCTSFTTCGAFIVTGQSEEYLGMLSAVADLLGEWLPEIANEPYYPQALICVFALTSKKNIRQAVLSEFRTLFTTPKALDAVSAIILYSFDRDVISQVNLAAINILLELDMDSLYVNLLSYTERTAFVFALCKTFFSDFQVSLMGNPDFSAFVARVNQAGAKKRGFSFTAALFGEKKTEIETQTLKAILQTAESRLAFAQMGVETDAKSHRHGVTRSMDTEKIRHFLEGLKRNLDKPGNDFTFSEISVDVTPTLLHFFPPTLLLEGQKPAACSLGHDGVTSTITQNAITQSALRQVALKLRDSKKINGRELPTLIPDPSALAFTQLVQQAFYKRGYLVSSAPIGKDTRAFVYKATQISSGRVVAIKIADPYQEFDVQNSRADYCQHMRQQIRLWEQCHMLDYEHWNFPAFIQLYEAGFISADEMEQYLQYCKAAPGNIELLNKCFDCDFAYQIMDFFECVNNVNYLLERLFFRGKSPIVIIDALLDFAHRLDLTHKNGVAHHELVSRNVMCDKNMIFMLCDLDTVVTFLQIEDKGGLRNVAYALLTQVSKGTVHQDAVRRFFIEWNAEKMMLKSIGSFVEALEVLKDSIATREEHSLKKVLFVQDVGTDVFKVVREPALFPGRNLSPEAVRALAQAA